MGKRRKVIVRTPKSRGPAWLKFEPDTLPIPPGYVALIDAFDWVGRQRFGTLWNGEEIAARNQADRQDEIARLIAEKRVQQMDEERAREGLPPLSKLSDDDAMVFGDQPELSPEKYAEVVAPLKDSYAREAEARGRHNRVVGEMLVQIASDQLPVYLWDNHGGLFIRIRGRSVSRASVEKSLIGELISNEVGKKGQLVVSKTDLEAAFGGQSTADAVRPQRSHAATAGLKALMRTWLEEAAAGRPDEPLTKDQCLDLAKQELGEKVSKNMLEEAWKDAKLPSSWRAPGRRVGT